jgi:hypothetical protein
MAWLRGWAATALAYTLAGLAVVGGVLATLARQRAKGRAEEQTAQRMRDLSEYQDTRRRVDDAVGTAGSNTRDMRAEWLREYHKRNSGPR